MEGFRGELDIGLLGARGLFSGGLDLGLLCAGKAHLGGLDLRLVGAGRTCRTLVWFPNPLAAGVRWGPRLARFTSGGWVH